MYMCDGQNCFSRMLDLRPSLEIERKITKRSGSPSSIERIGTWTTQNLYILSSNNKAKCYTPNIVNDLWSSSSLANMAALENPPQVALHTTDSLLLNMNGSLMTTPSVEQQMKLIGQWVHTGILIMGLITNPLIIYVLCKQRIGSEYNKRCSVLWWMLLIVVGVIFKPSFS